MANESAAKPAAVSAAAAAAAKSAAAAAGTKPAAPAAAKPAAGGLHVGEWFWRFLSVVMLFAVCWAGWIFYQIGPKPLATRAAFEAAAAAKPADKGIIAPAPPSATAPPVPSPAVGTEAPKAEGAPGAAPVAGAAPAPAPAAAVKEPPVNVDKLKLTETIEQPIPERGAKKK